MSGNLIASAAEHWMTVHGHVSHSQVDCSHFVAAVLQAAGVSGFKYITANEYTHSHYFRKVDTAEAGDIVHWPGHVAIVIDPATGTFIGSQTSTGVDKSSYKSNPYWSHRNPRTFLRLQAQ